jgi:hypothetical protein
LLGLLERLYQRIERRRRVVSVAGLKLPHTPTTVRVRQGRRQIQDDSYADTREHLGGHFIIDVTSLDAALEWAARAPCAATGSTEVRAALPPPPRATL